jgi:DNA-binding response OmpR family regulator
MNAPACVALIDDDPAWTEALADYFRDKGFAVRTAADGAGGLALLEGGGVDAVVLDLHLPGLDGFGVLQVLRQRLPRLTVVLASADEDENLPRRAREAGAFAFLPKTASPRLLLQTVQQALRQAAEHPVPRPWQFLLTGPEADLPSLSHEQP